ncbi:hypothetical protein EXS57_01540 [Candidatus Kaiserbacteria bacterium]|nr:hypothetical protein [Candidatus Kaiserbacteria bacterium]
MIADYATFIAHLKRTGRLKLLPQVLRELREEEATAKRLSSRKEMAADNPSLISGWRQIENGVLTDHSGKAALLDMYKKITA